MMYDQSFVFEISPEESTARVDRVISTRFPDFSRTYIQKLFENDHVTCNNTALKKGAILKAGSKVSLYFQRPPQSSLTPENLPLTILHEDDQIVVLNKAAGMVVHPGAGVYSGTLVHALLGHCELPEDPLGIRPGIIHRLDKDTSGVIVIAKTEIAHRELSRQFSDREVDKSYLALVSGICPEIFIDKPIGRNPLDRQKMCIREGGKAAQTKVTLLARGIDISYIEVTLYTGRTHQIRVHLSSIMHPIIGDKLYAPEGILRRYRADRQMLHAHRISFTHPTTGIRLSYTAPLPEDILLTAKAHGIPSTAPYLL